MSAVSSPALGRCGYHRTAGQTRPGFNPTGYHNPWQATTDLRVRSTAGATTSRSSAPSTTIQNLPYGGTFRRSYPHGRPLQLLQKRKPERSAPDPQDPGFFFV